MAGSSWSLYAIALTDTLRSMAVHSEDDATSLHTRVADKAHALGGTGPAAHSTRKRSQLPRSYTWVGIGGHGRAVAVPQARADGS